MGDQVRLTPGGGQPRRSALTLGAALLALFALVVGLLIGRLTAPDDHGSQSPAPRASAPGPSRMVDGVPVGFGHSRAGAVAALLSYSAVLGDPHTLLDPKRRAVVLRLIATDRYASTFQGRGGAALEQARRGPLGQGLATGARTIYLASPIAYRVISYDGQTARIEGWGVSVVGNDQGLTPRASWATTDTLVRWQNRDWRIDSVQSQDGPTPALAGQGPSDAQSFLGRLAGTHGVRHAP
jgi:hypothetical protein